jgi:outer membrane protein assembly factor BamB
MSDHFDEFEFPPDTRQAIAERGGDVFHTNTLEVLPANELGARDKRFAAGNLLLCNRSNSLIYIVDRTAGKLVWRWGLGSNGLVGPHHPTMLHNGNILIYDNGGSAPFPPRQRGYTRLVEVNPADGEMVWQYRHEPYIFKETSKFFSSSWGSVQRLPNGNTLSLDCHKGRVFEITPQGEIVWEYISPFSWGRGTGVVDSGMYRVYRYAYDAFPAADKIFAETDGHLGYAPAAIPIPPRLGLPPRR